MHCNELALSGTLFSNYPSSLLHVSAIDGHHQVTVKLLTFLQFSLYFNELVPKLKYVTVVPFIVACSLDHICLRVMLVFMFTCAVCLLWRGCFACYLVFPKDVVVMLPLLSYVPFACIFLRC